MASTGGQRFLGDSGCIPGQAHAGLPPQAVCRPLAGAVPGVRGGQRPWGLRESARCLTGSQLPPSVDPGARAAVLPGMLVAGVSARGHLGLLPLGLTLEACSL